MDLDDDTRMVHSPRAIFLRFCDENDDDGGNVSQERKQADETLRYNDDGRTTRSQRQPATAQAVAVIDLEIIYGLFTLSAVAATAREP